MFFFLQIILSQSFAELISERYVHSILKELLKGVFFPLKSVRPESVSFYYIYRYIYYISVVNASAFVEVPRQILQFGQ